MPVIVPHLIVEVFEDIWFRGRRGTVVKPTSFTRDIGFQDNISSIRIYKGPAFERNPKYKAIFYEDINFQGRRLVLGPGYYGDINDVAYKFGDKISSINFAPMQEEAGPQWGSIPLIVEVFRDKDFKGRHAIVLRDIPNTALIGLQNSISSVQISKGPEYPAKGCSVIFYAEPDFGGASLAIQIKPEDNRKNIPNLHILPQNFGDKISSIKIEGWSSSGEFTQVVFQEEFNGTSIKPELMWIDQAGGGSWQARQGYLIMRAEPGLDLRRDVNFDAPRLVIKISGDFSIETRIHVSPNLEEHGGLLVWRNESSFLRLEKTSGAHLYKGDVVFERHHWGTTLIGRVRGMQKPRELYLRIERRDNEFSGFASTDGVSWISSGTTVMGMGEALEVGLFAVSPGEKEKVKSTVTRFDYFRVLRRQDEVSRYKDFRQESPDQLSRTKRLTNLRSLTS
jgi:regulation of enolase protein 1 (concanavalin A-like superfamily)